MEKHPLRIPFRLQVLAGSSGFFTGFAVVMAVFFLYGPIPARLADHSGWRWVLGPFVCPLVAVACHHLFPYNPYRTRWGEARSLYRLDERDPDARRFLELLRSPAYHRVALVAAARLAVLLAVVMAGFMIVFRTSLHWKFPSPWFYQGLAGGALFAWILVKVRSIRWVLDAWAGEKRAA